MNSEMVLNHQAAYHSSPRQLTSLLELDEAAWSEPSADDLRGILAHQLEAPLLCDLGDEAQGIAGDAGGGGVDTGGGGREGAYVAKSIRHVLQAPSPPVEVLRLVKSFAKRHIDGDGNRDRVGEPGKPGEPGELGERAGRGGPARPKQRQHAALLPREVALVLYYLSIAKARCRLGVRISNLDDAALAQGLAWCRRQPWLDDSARKFVEEVADAGAGPTAQSQGE